MDLNNDDEESIDLLSKNGCENKNISKYNISNLMN